MYIEGEGRGSSDCQNEHDVTLTLDHVSSSTLSPPTPWSSERRNDTCKVTGYVYHMDYAWLMNYAWLCIPHGLCLVMYTTWTMPGYVHHMDYAWLCTSHGLCLVMYITWTMPGYVYHMDYAWLCTPHGLCLVMYTTWTMPGYVHHMDYAWLCTVCIHVATKQCTCVGSPGLTKAGHTWVNLVLLNMGTIQ